MELNNSNYFSPEMRKRYMGYSQFKEFLNCEFEALARVNGETEEKKTQALMIGSYIDAYFSKEMEDFVKENPDIFNKNGTLKSDYVKADSIIRAIEEDEMLLKYLSGEHQVIMTGTIAGVEFKIKIDSYFPGKVIVDQKIMKDLDPVWVEINGRNTRQNLVSAYRYDLEGAIYQEIVRQNTGEKLPFVLAIATKEDTPRKGLFKIDQECLDAALKQVEELAPRFAAIKRGEIEPTKCGKCSHCRSKEKVTGIKSFHELDPISAEEDVELY